MSNDVKLEPCPFCGGEASLWQFAMNGVKRYVECGQCRIRTHLKPNRAEAIAAWNARHQPQRETTENAPPVLPGERWIERWCGSGMWRGSSIWTTDSIGCHKNLVEHLGGDEGTHAAVRRIVAAHNAALTTPAPAAIPNDPRVPKSGSVASSNEGQAFNATPAPPSEREAVLEEAAAKALKHAANKIDEMMPPEQQSNGWKLGFCRMRKNAKDLLLGHARAYWASALEGGSAVGAGRLDHPLRHPAEAALTTPAPTVSTDDAIEQIVVGFSDKAILRLDIEEDDPRLSRVCDDMRQTVRAILSRLRGCPDHAPAPEGSATEIAEKARSFAKSKTKLLREVVESRRTTPAPAVSTEEIVAALEPFAFNIDCVDFLQAADDDFIERAPFKAGDYRRAAAILSRLRGEGE